jgi:NADH:ubiquinone oxidoreductase subunit 2 (subunit N)
MYLTDGEGTLHWREEPAVSAAIAVCLAGTLVMGVLPQPFVRIAQTCLLR